MPKKKIGAGNFVQPNDNDGYDVFVNWEIVDHADSHLEAVGKLYNKIKHTPVVRINDAC